MKRIMTAWPYMTLDARVEHTHGEGHKICDSAAVGKGSLSICE